MQQQVQEFIGELTEAEVKKLYIQFLNIMPENELVSYQTFIAKLKAKYNEISFKNFLKEVLEKHECNNVDNCTCSEDFISNSFIIIFREILR